MVSFFCGFFAGIFAGCLVGYQYAFMAQRRK